MPRRGVLPIRRCLRQLRPSWRVSLQLGLKLRLLPEVLEIDEQLVDRLISLSRSLRSALPMMRSISGGTSGANSAGGGGSTFRISAITSLAVSPSNAALPVTISYMTDPRLKMSLRASTCKSARLLRRHILRRAPHHSRLAGRRVDGQSRCGESSRPTRFSLSLAIPKSSTFTIPSLRTITLSGLMSRCTIPQACAADSALAI